MQVLLQGGEFHGEQLLHVERPAWSEVTCMGLHVAHNHNTKRIRRCNLLWFLKTRKIHLSCNYMYHLHAYSVCTGDLLFEAQNLPETSMIDS